MKKTLLIFLAAVLVLSLTACGGGPAASTGGGTSADKDSIVISIVNEPTQLDPQYSGDSYGSLIILNTHDPLVRRNSAGDIVPCLAESWGYSEDEMTITFKIREGVKFQDGSLLTAEDVAFSLNRAINNPASGIYTESFKEARVVDDIYVALDLLYPDIAVLSLLCGGNNAIVSKAIVERVGDAEYTNNICGTGPYKFVNWQKGSKITLTANEDYWQGSPSIKQVEFRILKETTTSMVALENGEVDMTINLSALDVEQVKKNNNLEFQETGSITTWTIGFNCQIFPMDNVHLRRALAMAINRDEVILGAVDGGGVPAFSIMPPPTVGAPSPENSPHIPYDVESAKAELAAAGYPGGEGLPTITLCVREDLTKKIGNVVQSNWAAIGVNCDIVVMERASLLTDIRAGKLMCYTVGNVALSMDASMEMATLDSSAIPDSNTCFYANPEYDALNEEQALQLHNPEKRIELVTKMMELEVRDAPRALIFHPDSNVAYKKGLDVTVSPTVEGYIVYNMSWR